jgi:hypothetical protein
MLYQPSTRFASPEDSDIFSLGRLAPALYVSCNRDWVPQSAATVGVHVASVVRNLRQPQVANLVESPTENRAFRMAVGSLSSGLAGNGCGCFPGGA